MMLPKQRTGVSTPGLLGVTLVALVSTGFIHPLWLLLATFCIFAGIGLENNHIKENNK